jgi:hypothetical protein
MVPKEVIERVFRGELQKQRDYIGHLDGIRKRLVSRDAILTLNEQHLLAIHSVWVTQGIQKALEEETGLKLDLEDVKPQ